MNGSVTPKLKHGRRYQLVVKAPGVLPFNYASLLYDKTINGRWRFEEIGSLGTYRVSLLPSTVVEIKELPDPPLVGLKKHREHKKRTT